MGNESAVLRLRDELREQAILKWVTTIDVEQALCEFSKYDAYCVCGISASKRFTPASGCTAD